MFILRHDDNSSILEPGFGRLQSVERDTHNRVSRRPRLSVFQCAVRGLFGSDDCRFARQLLRRQYPRPISIPEDSMTRNGKIARLPREIREQNEAAGHFFTIGSFAANIGEKCSRSLQAAKNAT